MPLMWVTFCLVARATDWEACFDNTHHDFGLLPRGATVYHRFRLINRTGKRARLQNLRVSCRCLVARADQELVEPGRELWIDVELATQFEGERTMTVYALFATTNLKDTPIPKSGANSEQARNQADVPREVALRLTARGRKDAMVEPGAVDFGRVRRGTSSDQTVILEYPKSWKVATPPDTPLVQCRLSPPRLLDDCLSRTLRLTLFPTVAPGTYVETLELPTGDKHYPAFRIPLRAEIEGALSFEPRRVDFMDIPIGSPQTRKVLLRGEKRFSVTVPDDLPAGLSARATQGERRLHVLTLTYNPTRGGQWAHKLLLRTSLPEEPIATMGMHARVLDGTSP